MTEVFKIVPAPAKTFWSLGLLALFITALLCFSLYLFIYIAYSSRYTQFELSEQELRIFGDIYGRSIPIAQLVTTQALKLDLSQEQSYQPKWRTNGNGLPGYRSGWFKLKNGEKALLFVTDPHSVVYVPTQNGYSLLMSVKEPERFLQSLHQIESL